MSLPVNQVEQAAYTEQAAKLLRKHIPHARAVQVGVAARGSLAVSFYLGSAAHSFLLKREAGTWYVREWILNARLQPEKGGVSGPRFQAVIAETLGALRKAPMIEVVDLRCPEKHRQLFAKVIVQSPLPEGAPPNLIEFSCPWCKRASGEMTFHYYLPDGTLVKTETTEPYIKQEPQAWYSTPPPALQA